MQIHQTGIVVNCFGLPSKRPLLRLRIFTLWRLFAWPCPGYLLLRYVSAALSLLFCSACVDLRPNDTLHTLDYLTFYEPSGWHLHIEGDGSGRLQHRNFNGRVLFYPSATFQLHPLPAHFQHCCQVPSQISAENCVKVVFYSEENNQKSSCLCPATAWMEQFFNQAFSIIHTAEGGSRDRRLLARQWLQYPPFGGS